MNSDPKSDPEMQLKDWDEIRQHRIQLLRQGIALYIEQSKEAGVSEEHMNDALSHPREILAKLEDELPADIDFSDLTPDPDQTQRRRDAALTDQSK